MAGVTVLGTGAWGTTLARLLADERLRQAQGDAMTAEAVMLWDHHPERATAMERDRENPDYLPGISFPPNLRVTSDLGEALRDRELVLFVTPSQRLREQARLAAPLLAPGSIVVSASKGLELGTRLRMSQVLRQELPGDSAIAALSGPNLA